MALDLSLYLVTDSTPAILGSRNIYKVVEEACKGGKFPRYLRYTKSQQLVDYAQESQLSNTETRKAIQESSSKQPRSFMTSRNDTMFLLSSMTVWMLL